MEGVSRGSWAMGTLWKVMAGMVAETAAMYRALELQAWVKVALEDGVRMRMVMEKEGLWDRMSLPSSTMDTR